MLNTKGYNKLKTEFQVLTLSFRLKNVLHPKLLFSQHPKTWESHTRKSIDVLYNLEIDVNSAVINNGIT